MESGQYCLFDKFGCAYLIYLNPPSRAVSIYKINSNLRISKEELKYKISRSHKDLPFKR